MASDVARLVKACLSASTSGNLMVCQQQIWLGPARAGLPVIVWVDTDRLHVLGVDGGWIKITAPRLSERDLARLRADGAHAK